MENLPAKIEGEKPLLRTVPGIRSFRHLYKGIESNNHSNTVYGLSLEEISICHLGALGKEVNPKIKESLGDIDILFIPIGGGNLLEPQKVASVATHLGAKIVIPMNYNEIQLKQFIKEFGEEEVMPADKLTIKKKDLVDKKGEILF